MSKTFKKLEELGKEYTICFDGYEEKEQEILLLFNTGDYKKNENNPYVLQAIGIFHEKVKNDIANANEYYSLAILSGNNHGFSGLERTMIDNDQLHEKKLMTYDKNIYAMLKLVQYYLRKNNILHADSYKFKILSHNDNYINMMCFLTYGNFFSFRDLQKSINYYIDAIKSWKSNIDYRNVIHVINQLHKVLKNILNVYHILIKNDLYEHAKPLEAIHRECAIMSQKMKHSMFISECNSCKKNIDCIQLECQCYVCLECYVKTLTQCNVCVCPVCKHDFNSSWSSLHIYLKKNEFSTNMKCQNQSCNKQSNCLCQECLCYHCSDCYLLTLKNNTCSTCKI